MLPVVTVKYHGQKQLEERLDLNLQVTEGRNQRQEVRGRTMGLCPLLTRSLLMLILHSHTAQTHLSRGGVDLSGVGRPSASLIKIVSILSQTWPWSGLIQAALELRFMLPA